MNTCAHCGFRSHSLITMKNHRCTPSPRANFSPPPGMEELMERLSRGVRWSAPLDGSTPFTPSFIPFVDADETNNEDQQRPMVFLEVGKTYRSGYGGIVNIIGTQGQPVVEFIGDNGRTYNIDGTIRFHISTMHNLVEEVEARQENPLQARVNELEQCLKETHRLVSLAATNGFTDDSLTMELLRNNAKIRELFPSS